MPIISINILTKNRAGILRKALESVCNQTFKDFEVVIINDGSTDDTAAVLEEYKKKLSLIVINHEFSKGIIASRQEALENSRGEYVALLDDDDEWINKEKLSKQIEWFNQHPKGVLIGSAVDYRISGTNGNTSSKKVLRSQTDSAIRNTMLLRNNFFTSTTMFKKSAAIHAGGFISDGIDVAEDYDLWLRLGKMGEMANFSQMFTAYRAPVYTKGKFLMFLKKQLGLIDRHKKDYPWHWLAKIILKIRLAM